MIATDEYFENFIEDDDERFSEIELRVLDLEKDISEWREARTRELPRPVQRRQREHGAAGSGYLREPGPELEPEPDLADDGYQADFTEPDIGLSWEAGEHEPGWEDDERDYGWSPGEPESGDAVTFRGASAPRQREFLRATAQPPLGRDQGRTQALIEHGRQTARPRTIRRQPARRDTPRQKATGQKATGQKPGRQDTGRQDTGRQDTGRQDTGRQDTGRQGTGRQDTGRQGTGRQGTGRQDTSWQDTTRQGKGRQGTSRQGTSRQGTGRPKTSRSGAARRGRSRRSRKVAIGSVAGLAVIGIGALIVLRPGPSWPASVATVRSQITTACQNPNVAAEPSQVNFACDKDTSQILWVFSLLTSGDDPGYTDARTGRKGLEPITPTQGGEIAWSLNLHHPYNPLSAVDSLEVAARAINNIIGGATLTSANGTPTVQPGLESKPDNCARYTGSAAIISHAGFPSLCASPVTSREGRAALVADVYKQWMPGASPVAAQNASVLFQNAGNPGDPQVQEILKSLPHGE
ncbi:MAG TPA: hypothetical protein VFW50_04100 [Streptosporangiaceae bacterium]|nr:hypothetical protein [Streptosporangiaceae bacterium]